MEEKRKSLRIPITAKVEILKENQEGIYFTENLSKGGFQLSMEEPPFVGTIVKAYLSLPNVDQLIETKCEVVWRQAGKACGLKIKQITKANQQLLETFLEENKS